MFRPMLEKSKALAAVVTAPLLLACAAGAAAVGEPNPTPEPNGSLRYEISLSARELYEYIDDERVNTYTVAVGREGHRTPTGQWGIHQVDWNPDWTPPDSEWAADAEYKSPGEDGNPMGRVRIMFNPPYTIHGTEDLESLGTAASHGSVRISNPDGIEVARRVMAFGGAERSEAWIEETLDDPYTMRSVSIPNPVSIVIYD